MSAVAELRPVLNHPVEARPGRTPEFELLLACCAQSFNGSWVAQAVSTCDYDWKRFISLAEHHRVVPQVYRCLAPYSAQLPDRHFAALRSINEDNVRKALWFTGELVRILKHLEARGIRAMPYKGPALAQTLYGDVTAREFSDLDMLVCPEDVRNVKAVLAQLGYKSTIELTARSERAYISSGYEYSFDSLAGPHLLELQWRIVPRFYSVDLDVTTLFERSEPVILGGHSFATLCPQDLLLVLCVHAAKHVWGQLSWLCDLAQLAGSARIDWEAAWRRAHQLGLQRIVAVNLLLAHDLLGLPLPPPVQSRLKKDHASEIPKAEILQVIQRSSHYDTESISYFRLMMRLRERRRDRFRLLWRLLWTPSIGEWSAMQLPEQLFPLYRVVRLLRLGARFVPRLERPQ
jgi:hypothetical protein